MAIATLSSTDKMFLGAREIFVCPICQGMLTAQDDNRIVCSQGLHQFEIRSGIPLLYAPDESDDDLERVTSQVKGFYEETPFPDYDDLDSPEALREKARRGIFAKLLDEQIPYGVKILEVGCGTGQLSNFLGLTWGRQVFGTDVTINSLRLAHEFKMAHVIEHVAFYQMNLFKPIFAPESFDIVICNGVLHHTNDPYRGFTSISRLVKRGGYIIIGLYNRFGRLPTDLKRMIFKLSGNRLQSLDPYLRRSDIGAKKKRAWFMDQYKHPHESEHTIGETQSWFRNTGIEFVNGIPKPSLADSISESERLFQQHDPGGRFDHAIVQMSMAASGREGGFFIMIGRKQ